MATICVALKYTPTEYYALTNAERRALIKALTDYHKT